MQPTKQHQEVGVESAGKVDVGHVGAPIFETLFPKMTIVDGQPPKMKPNRRLRKPETDRWARPRQPHF
jgi:hypothetical protein